MDIGVPYNIERILWLVFGEDGDFARECMEKLAKEKRFQLTQKQIKQLHDFGISSRTVPQADAMLQLKKVWETDKYLIDPHTALAVSVAYSKDSPAQTHSVGCISTAHPVKFSDAICDSLSLTSGGRSEEVLRLLEQNPPNHPTITDLLKKVRATKSFPKKDHYFRIGDDWTQQLKDIICRVANTRQSKSARSKL
eukprot:TRINITY_DN518_c0_g1_i1.p1 TRINITY_DN518_c0_g1~~TRINITY_DN518_c0_g1_i1.p1  ORF type:complete len:195 (+),score=26.14 TRINITY_DN518_c0_g1_i1:128-712(+)